MATMKELKESNTLQGLIIATAMQEYRNLRVKCVDEATKKLGEGISTKEILIWIDEEQEKAKAKVRGVLVATVEIVSKNLEEAKQFEVPDATFISNSEMALEKAASLLQMLA